MDEIKETTSKKKTGGLKKLLKTRKLRHGSAAIAITAAAVAVVILLNIAAGLLVDRFPDLKADFTAEKSFAISEDTKDYMSRLSKDIKLFIIAEEKDFDAGGTYFVQAKQLLEKMAAASDGKFSYEFVNTTENPNFTQKYPKIDWTTKDTVGVITCGEQYKGLSITECFTYDEQVFQYYQSYQWTGTTIEQAVVKGSLNVTTEDKVIVDVMTGEGESGTDGYEGLTALLTDNAYQVNEVSLLSGKLDENARAVLLFAPLTDISDATLKTLRDWLDNGGSYGRTLIYVPNADPRVGEQKTPNIDALLSDWGMELEQGYVYESDPSHRLNGYSAFSFVADYGDYYTENLKNKSIPVIVEYAMGINIKSADTAHALLKTTDKSGVYPLGTDGDFDMEANIKGEPLTVAAEGKKESADSASNLVVFGSKVMLSTSGLNDSSFNNGAFFMNIINTVADKDDDTVVIESKPMDNSTLGQPDEATSNTILILFAYVLPVLIIATGIVLWIRRRNR